MQGPSTARKPDSSTLDTELDNAAQLSSVQELQQNLGEVYCSYKNLLYRVAYRIVGEHFSAEDIVQNVFVKALSKPGRFNGGNVKSWLCRIARNEGINYLRKGNRYYLKENLDTEVNSVDVNSEYSPTPEVIFLEEERRKRVRAAIEKQKQSAPKIMATLELRANGMTYEEIAAAESCPKGTVMSRLNRGKKILEPELVAILDIDDYREKDDRAERSVRVA